MPQEIEEGLTELEAVADMVKGRGWEWFRAQVTDKILDLQSIRNLTDVKDPNDLVREITVRNEVVEILTELLKSTEGMADKLEMQTVDKPTPGFIQHL